MGTWQKIEASDIETGLMVRLVTMADTAFNGATIIAVWEESGTKYVRFARPMAYGSNIGPDRQPMLYCEVFEATVASTLAMAEVYVSRDGTCHTMRT